MEKRTFMQELQRRMPVKMQRVDLTGKRVGLLIVDEVVGFCEVGPGNFQPKEPDKRIEQMISETDTVAYIATENGGSVVHVCDTHDEDNIERPFAKHCIRGSGEENPVQFLSWLASHPRARTIPKDCMNAYIGVQQADGRNPLYEWICRERIEVIIVIGICTDICVLQAALTLLCVRQHKYPDSPGWKMALTLQEIVVYEPACATFDAPGHPREIEHHVALHMMQTQGAIIANELVF